MAFFFPTFDTNWSAERIEEEEVILNLDEFGTIKRTGTKIIASGESISTPAEFKQVMVAQCKTIKAAQYVMKKILKKEVVTIDEVRAIETNAPIF